MKVKIKFLQSGDSPDLGAFEEGDDRDMNKETAELLEKRGVLRILSEEEAAALEKDLADAAEQSNPQLDPEVSNGK